MGGKRAFGDGCIDAVLYLSAAGKKTVRDDRLAMFGVPTPGQTNRSIGSRISGDVHAVDVGRSVSDRSDDWRPLRTEEAGSRLVNAKAYG